MLLYSRATERVDVDEGESRYRRDLERSPAVERRMRGSDVVVAGGDVEEVSEDGDGCRARRSVAGRGEAFLGVGVEGAAAGRGFHRKRGSLDRDLAGAPFGESRKSL